MKQVLKRYNKFKAFNIHHLFIPAAINNKNRMQKQVAEKAVSSASQSLWQGFFFFICITKYKMIVIAECIMDQMKWLYIAWHVCWGTLFLFFSIKSFSILWMYNIYHIPYVSCENTDLLYSIFMSLSHFLTHSVLFFWC